jgi:hypothetical protein
MDFAKIGYLTVQGRRFWSGVALTLLTLPWAALPGHAENCAVCIGVNRYPGLRAGANLTGCVNDARMFAGKLKQYGFAAPVVLADGTARKADILAKITAMKSRLHPGDRVVVFFAGHGTISSKGTAVILPSDALDGSEAHDLGVAELYRAVRGLGGDAIQKTVVLDSCHSGGMVRGLGGLRGARNLRPRLYVRTAALNVPSGDGVATKKWQETPSSGGDDLKPVVGETAATPDHGGICYFTAAQKNEVANETVINGDTHGLFTYYLVRQLKGGGDLWRDVNAAVSDKVGDESDYEQKPQLYPTSALDSPVFGGAAVAAPKPLGLDAVYNLSCPNPAAVALRRLPDHAPIAVGSKNYFEITVGRDGYLVLLGRDPKNQLDVIYPKTPKTSEMAVHAGQTIRIPTNAQHFLVPDTVGSDSLKAILFTSAAKAEAMLKPFLDSAGGYGSLSVAAAKKAWQETEDAPVAATPAASPSVNDFFTSELTTQIVAADTAKTP